MLNVAKLGYPLPIELQSQLRRGNSLHRLFDYESECVLVKPWFFSYTRIIYDDTRNGNSHKRDDLSISPLEALVRVYVSNYNKSISSKTEF